MEVAAPAPKRDDVVPNGAVVAGLLPNKLEPESAKFYIYLTYCFNCLKDTIAVNFMN